MMKRYIILLLSLALVWNCATSVEAKTKSNSLNPYKIKIEHNREYNQSKKEIVSLFEKLGKLSNDYQYDALYKLYSDDFTNNDGEDKNSYFELVRDTWETFPDINYTTKIQNINIESDYATVIAEEFAYATSSYDSDMIGETGELSSYAVCRYHLKKVKNKWVISAEEILSEKSALKYGDARFLDIELIAPELVKAGQEYTTELRVKNPTSEITIASISRNSTSQDMEKVDVPFRKLPASNTLERVFKANTNNTNEYNIASVGITRTMPVNNEQIRVYMNGIAFVMTRINVVPKVDKK